MVLQLTKYCLNIKFLFRWLSVVIDYRQILIDFERTSKNFLICVSITLFFLINYEIYIFTQDCFF